MQTHIPGYPRIGSNREPKKACEQYWPGKISVEELVKTGINIRHQNWQLQKGKDVDLIPSNYFPFYDQVLDLSSAVGAIPARYYEVIFKKPNSELDLYFALSTDSQQNGCLISIESSMKHVSINE